MYSIHNNKNDFLFHTCIHIDWNTNMGVVQTMKINYIDNIKNEFRSLKERRVIRNGTIEIQNAMFRVDQPTIFGERNEKYIEAELEWYKSQSLNVNDLFDIYGSTVKIWKDVSLSLIHI